jgi:L,D-transpeptidase ErfK/SrfK
MNFPTVRSCSRRIAALVLATAAAGCTLLRTPPPPPAAPPPPPAPPPAPVLPLAAASHRFTLQPGQGDVVGSLVVTPAGADDTLPDIARRFNVGYEEIVRANPGVDPWVPGAGRDIVVPTRFVLPDAPHEGVVINVAAMRLYYYPKPAKGAPQQVITHPIGIGKVGWQTPEGTTKVVARVKDPVWVPPVSVRKEHLENGDVLPPKVAAGPDNPLGAHMFRLGWPSYLIHGTNKPYGVGMRSSHGCVRLYPEDIAILFDTVPIGTPVRVVNQPVVMGWSEGTLYAEAYGALEDDPRGEHSVPKPPKGKTTSPLWQQVRAHQAEIDWEKVRAVATQPRGIPVPVMKRDATPVPAILASLVGAAGRVRNALPEGATWDGQTGLLVDEAQYQEMIGAKEGTEAKAEPAAASPAQPPPAAPPAR